MFRTSDLYFAAYLYVAGVPHKGADNDGRRVWFLFEPPDKASMRDLKDGYYKDQAKVQALSYTQAVKKMKALVYQKVGEKMPR